MNKVDPNLYQESGPILKRLSYELTRQREEETGWIVPILLVGDCNTRNYVNSAQSLEELMAKPECEYGSLKS